MYAPENLRTGDNNAADERLSCMVELARQHARVLAR